MIIDEVNIKIIAGKGGDGHVSWRREKYIPKGGPFGGSGGKGGSVYFMGTSDLLALNQFRNKKEITGLDGEGGTNKKMDGKDAEDIYLKIPIGTIVKNLKTNEEFEIKEVGKTYLIAKGGKGGLGNWDLRSPRNTTPKVAEKGFPGEERNLSLNLKFIADIGLIGLPNAGKSSLLNVLTNANVKTANYPFTTLEPNLGNMNGKIIADIPGLIEGAHAGKGLGIKFLKHIEKTAILIHCIDSSSENILKDYETIKKEMEKYNQELNNKKEIILLTKIDLLNEKELKEKNKLFKKINNKVLSISIIDDKKVSEFKKEIEKIILDNNQVLD